MHSCVNWKSSLEALEVEQIFLTLFRVRVIWCHPTSQSCPTEQPLQPLNQTGVSPSICQASLPTSLHTPLTLNLSWWSCLTLYFENFWNPWDSFYLMSLPPNGIYIPGTSLCWNYNTGRALLLSTPCSPVSFPRPSQLLPLIGCIIEWFLPNGSSHACDSHLSKKHPRTLYSAQM